MFKKIRLIVCDVQDLPLMLSVINQINKKGKVGYDYVAFAEVVMEDESRETWMARFHVTNREWRRLISNLREVGTLGAMLDDDGSIWYTFKGEA